MSEESGIIRPFADHGNFTQIHNVVFDVIMPHVSPNAFKVLCFVIRKTKGFHKKSELLSYGDIQTGTGIVSPTTVSAALSELLRRGYILKKDGVNARDKTAYALNQKCEIKPQKNARTTKAVVHSRTTENVVPTTTKNVVRPTTENVVLIKESTIKESIKESTVAFAPEDSTQESMSSRSKEKAKRSEASNVGESCAAAIYDAYPKHVARKPSLKAIEKALEDVAPQLPPEYLSAADFLLARTVAYAEHCRHISKDPQFIPHPSTWFNQARYFDEFEKETNHVRLTAAEQQAATHEQLIEFGERCDRAAADRAATAESDIGTHSPDVQRILTRVAGRLGNGVHAKNLGNGISSQRRALELRAKPV